MDSDFKWYTALLVTLAALAAVLGVFIGLFTALYEDWTKLRPCERARGLPPSGCAR